MSENTIQVSENKSTVSVITSRLGRV